MKKFLTLIMMLTAGAAFSQSVPKFKKGDTVLQTRSKIYYIIDSVTYRPSHKQIFYDCHTLNGEI